MGNRTNYGTGRMTVDNRQKNERSRSGNPYSSHVKAGKHAGTVYNFKRKSRIRKSLTRLPILLEFIHKYIFLNFVSFYNGLNSNELRCFHTGILTICSDICRQPGHFPFRSYLSQLSCKTRSIPVSVRISHRQIHRVYCHAGWYGDPEGVRELASFGKEVADRTPG